MNRSELIDALSHETDTTKADCDRWLNAFIGTVEKNIKKGEGVRLVGFGTSPCPSARLAAAAIRRPASRFRFRLALFRFSKLAPASKKA